jgi:hypothetical protein
MSQQQTSEIIKNLLESNKKEYFKKHVFSFRQLLNKIKEDVNANLEEFSEGLGLSRQVVVKFLNDEDNKYDLPIGRANIITLWESLTNDAIYNSRERKRKVLKNEHIEARAKLRANGYNELLTTAGFQAVNTIDINTLPKKAIEKAHTIISRLSSHSDEDSLFWKVEDAVSEKILNRIIIKEQEKRNQGGNKSQEVSYDLSLVDNTPDKIWEFVRDNCGGDSISREDKENLLSATERYAYLGRETLNMAEVLELFYAIQENNRNRAGIDPNFRIAMLSYEIVSLDLYYKLLRQPGELKDKEMAVINHMLTIGRKAEDRVGEKASQKSNSSTMSPMKEIKLNCRMGEGKEFSWLYRSNSTTIQNIIDAITRGIGIKSSLKELSIEALSSGSDSLAKVSCIVEFADGTSHRGVWVDVDILVCIARSLICASEQWLKKYNLHAEIGDNIYIKVGEIIDLIAKVRDALYDYRTDLNTKRIGSESSLRDTLGIEESRPDTLEELIRDLKRETGAVISKIDNNEKIKQYFPHLVQFMGHIDQYAKILRIRARHIEGKTREEGKTKEEVHQELREFEKTFISSPGQAIAPIKLMYRTEKIINKFFRGDLELSDRRLWLDNSSEYSLEFSIEEVKQYLKNKDKKFVIPHTSLYHSLAELHGNCAKLDFYFSRKEHETVFKESIDGFLTAAYFSLKSDNGIRFSYWMCHAARSLSRIGKFDEADTMIDIANTILDKSFNPRDKDTHKKGVKSIYSLARCENLLFKNLRQTDSEVAETIDSKNVSHFVDALIGFHVIGFERLLCDATYNIHRYCELLKNQPLPQQEKLIAIWRDVLNENASISNNETKTFFEKFNYIIKSDEPDILVAVSKAAKEYVVKQWEGWFDKEQELYESGRQHPICSMINDNIFLRHFFNEGVNKNASSGALPEE